MDWPPLLLRAQGAYFAATGAWSLVDIDSFMRVTGPKTDLWLVKTVGALVLAAGTALIAGAARRPPSVETVILSIGSAAGLAAIEAYYVSSRTISPVYLLDAAAELLLIAAWAFWFWRNGISWETEQKKKEKPR